MKIIEQSSQIIYPSISEIRHLLKIVELAGRTCYKTEDKITEDSAAPFVCKIANVYKHKSILEHANITVKQITNRGVTHELVRHRHTAYSQESTRYCRYINDKFGNEITIIKPVGLEEDSNAYITWEKACLFAQESYFQMLNDGASIEYAREVLPNSTKTEIVVTTNLREWQHILELRTSDAAHPQIRALMKDLQAQFHLVLPELF